MLRLTVFMLLAASFASVGCGSGADDNIGQGLCVDGPGGYLPDLPGGNALNSNTPFDNSKMAFNFDGGTVFAIEPSMYCNKLLNEINSGGMWDMQSWGMQSLDTQSWDMKGWDMPSHLGNQFNSIDFSRYF